MDTQVFVGREHKRSKLKRTLFPIVMIVSSGFMLVRIFQVAPELLSLDYLYQSMLVVVPFYIGILGVEWLRRIFLSKDTSRFYVQYQVSEKYIDINFYDFTVTLDLSDIKEIRDPEITGQFMHFVLKSGREYSTPVPDDKIEFYRSLTKMIG